MSECRSTKSWGYGGMARLKYDATLESKDKLQRLIESAAP